MKIQETINAIKKQAEQGHADAQNNLGLMYHKGQGVSQNYKKGKRTRTRTGTK